MNEQLRILSAGAPKTGVARCAEVFSERNNVTVDVSFATAPVLREKVSDGSTNADIIVAPQSAFETFAHDGRIVTGSGGPLGGVRAAVVIKQGSKTPDISSESSLISSIMEANSLVFNVASSGQYIEQMIEDLGIAESTAHKTIRTPTGAGVMEHLSASNTEFEIGFGQQTEIQVQIDKGLAVTLVGTLPGNLEKITNYSVGVLSESLNPELAGSLVDFMVSPEGKKIFEQTGVN